MEVGLYTRDRRHYEGELERARLRKAGWEIVQLEIVVRALIELEKLGLRALDVSEEHWEQ